MKRSKRADTNLSKLLARLDTKADAGLARTIFQGRAVSKSEESLHLATPSGLIAIPLSEVEEVREASPLAKDPALVSVVVRNGDLVKPLVTVQSVFPWPDPLPGPPGVPWPLPRWPRFPFPNPLPTGADAGTVTFKYTPTLVNCTDSATGDAGTDDTICDRVQDSVPEEND